MEKQIKLEHNITFGWLIRFALPTILSSIFMNLYSTVDGIFVARWVSTDALSAINITMPLTYLASALGMIWFCVNRNQVLYVVRPKWRLSTLTKSCINGSYEMVSVLAFSVITILFNRILMKLGGADGVASLSIIWYAQGLFGGLFRGYINGIASVVSYNFGRSDTKNGSRHFSVSVFLPSVSRE